MRNVFTQFAMTVLLTLAIAGTAAAQRGGQMMHGQQTDGQKTDGDMPMMGMMMKGGMMGGGMMKPQVTATSDGGAVVVVGSTIMKYDKNLDLVKKTEIDIDEKEMMGMMEKMQQRHTKCREMMMQKMQESKDEPDK